MGPNSESDKFLLLEADVITINEQDYLERFGLPNVTKEQWIANENATVFFL